MSNLLKFILMALAWGLLFLGSYFGCIKPEYCPEDQAAVTVPVTPDSAPVITDNYAVVSSYGSNDVLTGSLWGAELDALFAKYQSDPDQALEVTGLYYEGETSPSADFENMGLYRADQISQLLMAKGIPAGNIRQLSRKVSGPQPASDDRFDAGDFAWGSMTTKGPELVEVDKDEIKIRFPFDKSARTLGEEVENYLQTLAARVKESQETISIVGHTDNIDSDAYNLKLGQNRADFVKQRLLSYGVDPSLISTSSKGESVPEASNATADGRRINRRAVVRLNRAQ